MWIKISTEEIYPSYEFEIFDENSLDHCTTNLAEITEAEYLMLKNWLKERNYIQNFLKAKYELDIEAQEIFPNIFEGGMNKKWKESKWGKIR